MNRVVVITGASGGIGKCTCQRFVAMGDSVWGLCRSGVSLEGVKSLSCDVTNRDQVFDCINSIVKAQGKIDCLICNAGYGIAGSVEFATVTDIQNQFNVNVIGAVNCISAALPHMRQSRGGKIILTSSIAGLLSIPFQAFYSMSKAAINSLTMALRNELKPFNIKVCALLPGDIKTGFTAARSKNLAGQEVYTAMNRSIATMEKDEQNGMPPTAIANALYRLSNKPNPKPYYSAGAQYRLIAVLSKLLPNRLQSWLLGKLYA